MTVPNKYCKNKEWLYDQYINKKKSCSVIAKEIGILPETVRIWLKRHEISARNGSECHSGELHPMFGKHHSEETKKKISQSNTGNTISEETRQKLSLATSGSNNPRYGAKLSQEQIEKQRTSLLEFYNTHPESKIEISEKRKQYYKDHPNASKKHSEYLKQFYIDHPEVAKQAGETRIQYYKDHPLTKEEKEIRYSHLEQYFIDHPEARREHSKLMKVNNPSSRPEVASKISQSMVEWHKNNANSAHTGCIPGKMFTRKDGSQLWLRSSYEVRFANILEELKINWKYEPYAFYLTELNSSYRPDIYIPDMDLWIEIKGYLSWSNKQKLITFHNEYPTKNLVLIYLKQLEEIEENVVNRLPVNFINDGIKIIDQINYWKSEDIELEQYKKKEKIDKYEIQ